MFAGLELLLKAAGHKYLRRLPTGKAKPRWAYVYAEQSKHHNTDFQVGEKFKLAHEGQVGHYEVKATHGDYVTLTHDETGHEFSVHKDHVHQAFQDERHTKQAGHTSEAQGKAQQAHELSQQAQTAGTPAAHRAASTAHTAAADSGAENAALHRQLATAHIRAAVAGEEKARLRKETKPRFVVQAVRKPKPGLVGTKDQLWASLINTIGGDAGPDHTAANAKYMESRRNRRAAKPGPYRGGSLDAINQFLERKRPTHFERLGGAGDTWVSSLREGVDKLTAGIRRWDDPKLKTVLGVLRQVPGLENIRIPQEELDRIQSKTVDKEQEAYYRDLQEAQAEDPAASFDPDALDADPNFDADTSFDFGFNVAEKSMAGIDLLSAYLAQSGTGEISPEKARQILHDGTIRGKPITDQQRKYFGAIGGHLPAPKAKKSMPENTKARDAIAALLRKDPKPDDSAVHALAERLGMEVDDLEEQIYAMAGEHVAETEKSMDTPNSLNDYLCKAKGRAFQTRGGWFTGPRGGKWADAQMTVAWKEGGASGGAEGGKTAPAKAARPKAPVPYKMRASDVITAAAKMDPKASNVDNIRALGQHVPAGYADRGALYIDQLAANTVSSLVASPELTGEKRRALFNAAMGMRRDSVHSGSHTAGDPQVLGKMLVKMAIKQRYGDHYAPVGALISSSLSPSERRSVKAYLESDAFAGESGAASDNDGKRLVLAAFAQHDHDTEKSMQGIDQLGDYLRKGGGEGSRGGKIIGHTSSGKPIYGTAHHPSHEGFSAKDHEDAAAVHDKIHKENAAKMDTKDREGYSFKVSDDAMGERDSHRSMAHWKMGKSADFSGDNAAGAGGLPHGATQFEGSGPEDGGALAGVGKTGNESERNTGSAPSAKAGAKLSEDDVDEDEQMKDQPAPGQQRAGSKKMMGKSQRAYSTSPAGQLEQTSYERAVAVSHLHKSRDLVIGTDAPPQAPVAESLEKATHWKHGDCTYYSNASDLAVERLLKSQEQSGFRGDPPRASPQSLGAISASSTAVHMQKSGRGLVPAHTPDLVLPNGIVIPDSEE